MSYDGDESSDKCINFIILEKEFFCLRVFLFRDEDILPIAFEKWFPEPSTEDIVVRERAYHRAKSSHKSREKWVDISCYCRYSCGYHDELRWHRDDRRFHRHEDENHTIVNRSKCGHELFYEVMHELGLDNKVPYMLYIQSFQPNLCAIYKS